MKTLFWLALLMPFACVAQAATVYRSVDADGKIIYSDKPPPGSKVDKTLNFADLPSSPLPESVLRYQEELLKSMQKRLTDAQRPVSGRPVLFTTKWCAYCKQAKAYLAEKQINYQEHDIETPAGMQALLSSVGKRRGVPLLLWNDRTVLGFSRPAYDVLFGGARR
jgi:glutaredoxin